MKTEEISFESLMLLLNGFAERFKESEKRFQESEKRFEESEKEWQEIKQMSKETERRFQETEKRFQAREKEWEEIKQMSKETDRRFRETDKKIREVHGLFTSQWGKLVEAIVRPACLKLFRERGIDVSRTHEATTIEVDKIKKAEYDAILDNGSEVVIVEVKTTLRKKDVEYFIKKLGEVKTYMPEYNHKKVYGAMAAISFDREADDFAIKQGLFMIKSSGDGVVKIANAMDFKPKAF